MKNRFIYIIKAYDDNLYYKIGITNKIEKRLKALKTGNNNEIEAIFLFQSDYASKIESKIHLLYKTKRVKGEWFLLSNDEVEKVKNKIIESENILNKLKLDGNIFID